jgi:hypothetical protein
MPPPGDRYVTATWIAIIGSLSTIVVGTAAVLAVRESLPERIVVRWSDPAPDVTLGLSAVLAVAAGITVLTCAAVLAAGVVVHRSIRHGLAGYALGLAIALGGALYCSTVGQAFPSIQPNEGPPHPVVFTGCLLGWAAGWWLTRWVRVPAPAREQPPAVPSFELSPHTRLMWDRALPDNLWLRLGSVFFVGGPLVALYWWMGLPLWMSVPLLCGVCLRRSVSSRRSTLVIDYSGVGLRGKGGRLPSPISLAEISSAELTSVAALRDFGGLGHVTAPDGRQGWIMRSGEALVVHRRGKPDFVYTVDGADEAAGVLNTLVADYQSRDQTLTA